MLRSERANDPTQMPMPFDLYADGVLSVENLGTNFRTIYFVWSMSPSGVRVRSAVLAIVRPRSSIPAKGYKALLLDLQDDPCEAGVRALAS